MKKTKLGIFQRGHPIWGIPIITRKKKKILKSEKEKQHTITNKPSIILVLYFFFFVLAKPNYTSSKYGRPSMGCGVVGALFLVQECQG
jgi:hypothetical protein